MFSPRIIILLPKGQIGALQIKNFTQFSTKAAILNNFSENEPRGSEYEREIKRKYDLLDVVNKKIYGHTKNHLAFTLKHRFDKDMQPRYYTPLRKSTKTLI